jgi:hypothetical protein
MLDAWICHAVETELADLRDQSDWRKKTYGIYSGIRQAYEARYVQYLADGMIGGEPVSQTESDRELA